MIFLPSYILTINLRVGLTLYFFVLIYLFYCLQILRENYLFNFGDHGGVTAAVKFYKSEGETSEFLLSTDEGESFKSYKFIDEKIRVYGLMTEPGENTTVFTLFGSTTNKHAWMIVNIDVKNIFGKQTFSK